jgi:phosphonate dehydrogenase
MKPIAMIPRHVDPAALLLLTGVCELIPCISNAPHRHQQNAMLGNLARAWLVTTPERIDEAVLRYCHKLSVIACAFRMPEHIDIPACTRRGIWLTTVDVTHGPGAEAELEAARNILDVLAGDVPRRALNDVLRTAA